MSIIKRLINKKIKKNIKLSGLGKNPQLKGVVLKVRIITPKKPNSARRPAVKILASNKKNLVAHIPGIGHNLRKHSTVLIRGGGARDLPGVSYTCIRGVLDLAGVLNRTKRRSIYGIQTKEHLKLKVRRKFRQN